VLYIDMPPERVDVNVHPQKAEVRFHDARELQGAVIRVLNEGLGRAFSVPALGLGRPSHASAIGSPGGKGTEPFAPRTDAFPRPDTFVPSASSDAAWPVPAAHVLHEGIGLPYARSEASSEQAPPSLLFPERPTEDLSRSLFASADAGFYGRLRFLSQVRATFLLCEGDDGIYVLDQHAAAERVTFHRLQTAYKSKRVASQRLLAPEIVMVGEHAAAFFHEVEEEVLALGFEVRAAGERAVAVHAVPSLLARGRATASELVTDLAAELARTSGRPFGARVDLVLATMACHGSVRAGDILEPQEVRALLSGLDEVDFSGHCPHGRPVVTRLSFEELERRVGR
jgi:DNA mismatch repair protein MutL